MRKKGVLIYTLKINCRIVLVTIPDEKLETIKHK